MVSSYGQRCPVASKSSIDYDRETNMPLVKATEVSVCRCLTLLEPDIHAPEILFFAAPILVYLFVPWGCRPL
jgi:hypothetical protein